MSGERRRARRLIKPPVNSRPPKEVTADGHSYQGCRRMHMPLDMLWSHCARADFLLLRRAISCAESDTSSGLRKRMDPGTSEAGLYHFSRYLKAASLMDAINGSPRREQAGQRWRFPSRCGPVRLRPVTQTQLSIVIGGEQRRPNDIIATHVEGKPSQHWAGTGSPTVAGALARENYFCRFSVIAPPNGSPLSFFVSTVISSSPLMVPSLTNFIPPFMGTFTAK